MSNHAEQGGGSHRPWSGVVVDVVAILGLVVLAWARVLDGTAAAGWIAAVVAGRMTASAFRPPPDPPAPPAAQGANTQAIADARALRAWRLDASAAPASVTGFRLDRDLLADHRKRNEIFLRGMLCLLASYDARDLLADLRLRDVDKPLEIHHLFPKKLGSKKIDDCDAIVNFAIVTESTNATIRNESPAETTARPNFKKSSLPTQCIPLMEYQGVNWEGFKAARQKLLIDRITEKLTALSS
ncbi:hypothetical protein [Polyangium sorediatum]|uniref:DUF1524 domain-containing protein n=1 Tax=Polyangium sorediatum TaxID=889274 RepID=A0ABT6NL60_9BACT|nr:hypothetical protein [Polyangium sorediatum]MDI1429038.1 hypothetical protein [Polyangium sorediatum]